MPHLAHNSVPNDDDTSYSSDHKYNYGQQRRDEVRPEVRRPINLHKFRLILRLSSVSFVFNQFPLTGSDGQETQDENANLGHWPPQHFHCGGGGGLGEETGPAIGHSRRLVDGSALWHL